MNIRVGTIDRKSVLTLAAGVLLILWIRFGIYGAREAPSVTTAETVPQAELRLKILRQAAATIPGKEERFKQAAAKAELQPPRTREGQPGSARRKLQAKALL